MDGDVAPLLSLVELCEETGAHLIVDEAHGTGIFGNHGEGLCCDLNLENRIFARVYTFGKAMGMHGACIAGSRILIDYLINFARPFIYTTALPPHALVTMRKTFEKCDGMSNERLRLMEVVSTWKVLCQAHLPQGCFSENNSPVQVVVIPGNDMARRAQQRLEENGIDARAILSPTVKAGEERIRICLHVYNSDLELEKLIVTLKEILT
jgi:8-amino-7-oxononanoate synthase